MKLLSEKIKRSGYTYELLKRTDKAAIYKQIPDEVESTKVYYEVFKIRISKAKVMFGVELPEKEKFPSDEDFGKSAWTCTTLERAEEIYERINSSGDEI
jgi:hypothetical protein